MTTPASTSFTGSAVVCGLRDMYPGGRTVQTAISCPDCDVPAEITERFSLPARTALSITSCCAAPRVTASGWQRTGCHPISGSSCSHGNQRPERLPVMTAPGG